MTMKDQDYSTGTGSDLSGELFRPIDHFTEERREWIDEQCYDNLFSRLIGVAKKHKQQESPRVSITEDAEVEAEKEQLSQKSLLTGILVGMAVLLAWMVQLGLFPAVCG